MSVSSYPDDEVVGAQAAYVGWSTSSKTSLEGDVHQQQYCYLVKVVIYLSLFTMHDWELMYDLKLHEGVNALKNFRILAVDYSITNVMSWLL